MLVQYPAPAWDSTVVSAWSRFLNTGGRHHTWWGAFRAPFRILTDSSCRSAYAAPISSPHHHLQSQADVHQPESSVLWWEACWRLLSCLPPSEWACRNCFSDVPQPLHGSPWFWHLDVASGPWWVPWRLSTAVCCLHQPRPPETPPGCSLHCHCDVGRIFSDTLVA